jgi:RNA polymerase sigma-70 factor (ECF subfamily)
MSSLSVDTVHYASFSPEQLVCACVEADNAEAWKEFVCRFRRPISLSVIRIAYQWGHDPGPFVDDLLQETYLKLCADRCQLLREFSVQHPEAVFGYIKTIAANVAHDYFKSRYSQKRGAGRAPESLEETDPKAGSESFGGQKSMEDEILLKQIDGCLATHVSGPDQARDRLIFWLHYQQGMSAKAIASLPKVSLTTKGVESALFRLTRIVREHLMEASGEESGAGEKGFRPAESF